MVRESLKILLAGCLLFLFLASCCPGGGRNRKLPKSTGQPYEVVLEGDTDSIVTKILTEEVPALPNPNRSAGSSRLRRARSTAATCS